MRAPGRRAISAPSTQAAAMPSRESFRLRTRSLCGRPLPPPPERRFAHVATSVNALLKQPRMNKAIGAANGISLLITAFPRLLGCPVPCAPTGSGWSRKAARSSRHGNPRQGCTSARRCCHTRLGPACTPEPRLPTDQPTLTLPPYRHYRDQPASCGQKGF